MGLQKDIAVVDLFCGVGGMTHGFVKEGFNVIAGLDIDSSCKYAYEKNNGAMFLSGDLDRMRAQDIAMLYPRNTVRILIGCAPCQPFSKYSRQNKKNDKWQLLYSFAEIISVIKPDIVSMENVPELLAFNESSVYKDFIKNLQKNNYHIETQIVYCPDYGIPQKRSRLVLLASQLGEIKLIKRTHSSKKYRTVEQTIRKLSRIEAGGTSLKDSLHRSCTLSELNMKRMKNTPYGGSWKDWPNELICRCHKKKSGKSYGSIYGRMTWEDPSPTITTQFYGFGNGRFGHPVQNRAISFREAAMLQTFPKYYELLDPKVKFSAKKIGKHIGNAVPVRLARIIARSIRKHVEEYYESKK